MVSGPLASMDIVRERARLDEMHRNRVESIAALEARRIDLHDALSADARAELAEIERELDAKRAAIVDIEGQQRAFEFDRARWREEEVLLEDRELRELLSDNESAIRRAALSLYGRLGMDESVRRRLAARDTSGASLGVTARLCRALLSRLLRTFATEIIG